MLGQELAQLLLHRGARVWIELYSRFERSLALPLTVLGILLAQCLGRRRFERAQRAVELLVRDRTRLISVDAVEDHVELGVVGEEVKAHRLDRATKLLLVNFARAVLIPLLEQVNHARRRACKGVTQGVEHVLVHVDLPAAISIERLEALAQLLLGVFALLAFPDHRHKLVEIELLIAIYVMGIVLHRIAPHAAFKGLLAGTRLVIALGRLFAATVRRGSRLPLF